MWDSVLDNSYLAISHVTSHASRSPKDYLKTVRSPGYPTTSSEDYDAKPLDLV